MVGGSGGGGGDGVFRAADVSRLRGFVGGGRGDSGVEEKRGERGRTVRAAWDALLGA